MNTARVAAGQAEPVEQYRARRRRRLPLPVLDVPAHAAIAG